MERVLMGRFSEMLAEYKRMTSKECMGIRVIKGEEPDILDNKIQVTMVDYDVMHVDEKLQPHDINSEYIEVLKSQKKPLSCQNNFHLISRYESEPIVTVLRAIAKHINELEKLHTMDNCPKCGRPLSHMMSTKSRKYCNDCDIYFKVSGGELIEVAPPRYNNKKLY